MSETPKETETPKEKKTMVAYGDLAEEEIKNEVILSAFRDLKKSRSEKRAKVAFHEDPEKSEYAGIYKRKTTMEGIPFELLKNVRDNEELIGGIILPLKGRQISLFGLPRANRFDIGFEINLKPEVYEKYSKEEIEKIKKEVIPNLRELILNCGRNDGLKDREKMTFSQYLYQVTEDMYLFGWWATELIKDDKGDFHSFRPVDAGTIAPASNPEANYVEAKNVKERAADLFKKLDKGATVEKFLQGGYTWVQVINGKPFQTFNDDELLMWYLNPSTDIARNGYPVSPIERMMNTVTTHINLTVHNKLFFVNGRAARNILVFKTENIDEEDISAITSGMTSHINSANASWRLPVFGIGPNDNIEVMPLDGAGRDMEFQYLADLNKRMILSAFQVSPDEIAALSYLSKGTNSQALSESNSEWKLLKSQESGFRPVIINIESFLNERLLPKINPEWARLVNINLAGLDADSPEKEASRLQQDSAIYLTMNQIMDRVEGKHVPLAGNIPLSAAYLAVLEKYYTMGQILEAFDPENNKGASQNPDMAFYIANPAWFQFQQLKQMQQQAQEQQAQMQQQGAQQPGQPGQEAQPDGLDTAINQLNEALSKTETVIQHKSSDKKRLHKVHSKIKDKIMDDFERESKKALDSILKVAEDEARKK